MEVFKLKDEYIQLNQLIKAIGWCENGAQANVFIENGWIIVNGIVEYRKRNKIRKGSIIEFENNKIVVQ